jgi:polyisoprenyl-phosphate glycosyltransferase
VNAHSDHANDTGGATFQQSHPSETRHEESGQSPTENVANWNILIIIPIFNDWRSLERLLNEIDALDGLQANSLRVLVVDDASTEECPRSFSDELYRQIASIDIIKLSMNLGHQRAVAVGLVEAAGMSSIDSVIVMDGDGEDRPTDIPRLLDEQRHTPGTITCAQRSQRSEGFVFLCFYKFYKIVFRALTGARIDFGNYCLIPRQPLDKLVNNPAIWNNLAAAICRSRLSLTRVSTVRGTRYAGRPQMNFVALVLHAFTAITVYGDLVMVRIVLCMTGLCVGSFLALLVVAGLRLFTDLAIPGWASQVGGLLVIIILQSLLIAAVAAFQVVAGRSTRPMIPALDAAALISDRRRVAERGMSSGQGRHI